MSLTHPSPLARVGQVVRTAALMVVAGIWRAKSLETLEAAMDRQPIRRQAVLVVGVLAGLFVLALIFAQAGWVGILVYWLGLIVIVR